VSSPITTREELLAALDHQIRASSAVGVLFSHAVAARLGMNSSDLECLDIINLAGPVTAGTLASATGLTTGAITGVVDRLEAAGLARRERDAGDRRKVLVHTAPGAIEKILPLYGSLQAAMAAMLSDYDDAELALLVGFFARARAIMAAETRRLREGG
jgi:DNA-binding MarR family transcriptional regulator